MANWSPIGLTGQPLLPALFPIKSQDYSTEVLVSATRPTNTHLEVTNAINGVCDQRAFSAATNSMGLIRPVLEQSC